MTIETAITAWLQNALSELTDIAVVYQHADDMPYQDIVWFTRGGDSYDDEMNGNQDEADIVYFDVEIYGTTTVRQTAITQTIKSNRDFSGTITHQSTGYGHVQLIDIEDQTDEYEPQAEAENLPPYLTTLRMAVYQFTAPVG